MSRIVIRSDGAGEYWACDECGGRGMSLQGGPHRLQLRYAQEKHRCRYVKGRECNSGSFRVVNSRSL